MKSFLIFFCSVILVTLSFLPAALAAGSQKVIYDGRLSLTSTRLSPSEEALMKAEILREARKAWKERARSCAEGFTTGPIDIAAGSFTRPKAEQKAIIYSHCVIGHNVVLNESPSSRRTPRLPRGLRGGGSERHRRIADINGNGLSEILIASGGTNMGETWRSVSIIEIPGKGVTESAP